MEKITKEMAIESKNKALEYLRGCKYNYEDTRKVVNEQTAILEQYVKESGKIKEVHFVHIENIVSDAPCENCICLNGMYYGVLIQDDMGNSYSTIFEVKDKLGDSAFIINNNNEWAWEYAYFEELELMVGHSSLASYDSFNKVLKKNDGKYVFFVRPFLSSFDSNSHSLLGFSPSLCQRRGSSLSLLESAKQMFNLETGIVNISGNRYVALDTVENIHLYLSEAKNCEKSSSQAQKEIDKLLSEYKLSEVDFNNTDNGRLITKTVVERLSEQLCVVRWVYKYNNEVIDGMRIYVDSKKIYACKRNNTGDYVKINHKILSPQNFTSQNFDLSIGDLTGTRLQYTKEIVEKAPEEYKIQVMLICLIDEKMEQLFKMGFAPSIIPYLADVNEKSFIKTIKSIINSKENEKNFNKWIGLNAYQLNKVIEEQKNNMFVQDDDCEKYISYGLSTKRNAFTLIRVLKRLFTGAETDSISHIDNETFDNMFENVALNMWRKDSNRNDSFFDSLKACVIYACLKNEYNDDKNSALNAWCRYLPKMYNFTDNEYRRYTNYRHYSDYLTMMTTMERSSAMKLFPKSQDELIALHDVATALYKVNVTKVQQEKFKKNLEKVKDLKYEAKDVDFIIKVPEKPEDIVIEGSELHHCVASYVPKIANGMTNIVFVRRKEKPDEPFFTVEVDNNKIIQQVHGLSNCNISAVEGLLDFVEEWAKKKHLKIGNITQVR